MITLKRLMKILKDPENIAYILNENYKMETDVNGNFIKNNVCNNFSKRNDKAKIKLLIQLMMQPL